MKDICRDDDEHFRLSLQSLRFLKLFFKREKCKFWQFDTHYMHPLSFPLGINYIDRTEENCLDVYYCCYYDDFCFYYILAAGIFFAAHMMLNCAETSVKTERSPRTWPLLSDGAFHLEKKYLYLSYHFRFHLKFSRWPSWHFIAISGFTEFSSKEPLLLECVM